MKRITALILLLVFTLHAQCQVQYKLKKELDKEGTIEMLKYADSVFFFVGTYTYKVTNQLVLPVGKLWPSKMAQPGYLEDQERQLKANPVNIAAVYNRIAQYYEEKQDKPKAIEYFNISLQHLKVLPGAKDSARYYATRGALIGGVRGAKDLEKAYAIDPSDSILVRFYPTYLMARNNYTKAREVLIDALKAGPDPQYVAYITLCGLEATEAMKGEYTVTSEKAREMYSKDVYKLVNFDQYDGYVNPKDPVVIKIKEINKMLISFVRFLPTMADESLKPTKKDIEYLKERDKYFTRQIKEEEINDHGVNYALGSIKIFQGDYAAAALYYEEDLQVCEELSKKYLVQFADVYNSLAMVYYLNKRPDMAIKTLMRKLDYRFLDVEERNVAYIGLAKLYFKEGDLAKAEQFALAALAIKDSFEANLLMAYIALHKENPDGVDKYLQKAVSLQADDTELWGLVKVIAVYRIFTGDYDTAYKTYDDALKYAREDKCEECRRMLDKYLVLIN